MESKPTTKITPESAMAGQCFAGSSPEEWGGAYTSVEPFEVQKRYFSNKPLVRQKIKIKKKNEKKKEQ